METVNQNEKSRISSSLGEVCKKCSGYLWWLVLLAVISVLFWGFWGGGFSGVDQSSYQAVFLTSGQVYFGKLSGTMGSFLTMEETHYLQVASTEGQQPGVPPISLNIISLEIQPHAPSGKMYISRDQVLFWENLKPDSQAVSVIKQQKEAQAR